MTGLRMSASNPETADRQAAEVPHPAAAIIGQLELELNRLQRSIRLAIQAKLMPLSGQSLGSLRHHRMLVESLHELLDGHGLRVRCSECGRPAILRVSPRGGAPHGVFVFDHTIEGRRTFHGGRTTIPEFHLVAKPARRKVADTKQAAG